MDGIFSRQVFGRNCLHHCLDWEMSSMDGEMSSKDESVICGCHPWMASTDGRVIHGWVAQMTLLSMDDISPSMDDTFPSIDDIPPSMDDISLSIDAETSSLDESVICGCHPWMTLPSVDVSHGWQSWSETTDDRYGRSNSLPWTSR